MINLLFKFALFLFLSFLGCCLGFMVFFGLFGFGWLGLVLFCCWVLFVVIIVAFEWYVDGFAGYIERLEHWSYYD
ncbi:MAG: hypothetical protein DRR19_29090 [Candidatus Parabeggiatoa sp. nov. 1]|nr:MAG: hypothetical protein DRR19_29090 [Gammaproteobacteria bacterium]